MSWWYSLDKAGQISKLAYSALKNAQQKIDEVLDINDNEDEESKTNLDLHSALYIPENESTRPASYFPEQQEAPECTQIESRLADFALDSHLKSSGPTADDQVQLNKIHPEFHPSLTGDEHATNPNQSGEPVSSVHSANDADSRGRMLAALNLFSLHSLKDTPRLHRASGSVGDNLSCSSVYPFDTAHTLIVEPENTATGSDFEVLSGCTSTNEESGHLVTPDVISLERIVFQSPVGGISRPIISGIVDGTQTLSGFSRHRRAVSASNTLHFGSSKPQEEDLSFAFQRLLKNYAEKKALLRIREAKILQLSRENCGLREVNATLGEQLKGRGTAQDLSEMTAEFTERLAQTECRLRLVSRERDQLRLNLSSAQARLKSSKKQADEELTSSLPSSSNADVISLNKRITELERALKEKTVQVSELMREGEQLAQIQLKGNTAIKQLRAKEKEARKCEQILSEKNEQLNSQLERLRNDFHTKEEIIRELSGQLEHLTKITQTQESEIQTLKVQYTHTQSSLKEKDNQIEDLNRALLDAHNNLTEAETRAEHAARSSAHEQTLRESCAALRVQLDAARLEHSSLRRISDERYSQWHEEREYYQRLIAEGNSRLESMEEHVRAVAQPALQQLESLQMHMKEQSEDWHRREVGLNQQLKECQKSALASSESERAVRQQLRVLEGKLTELNENGSRLQSEKESLKEQLDAMHEKLQLACQAEKELLSQLVALKAEQKADSERSSNLRAQLRQEQTAREFIAQENEQLKERIRQLRASTAQQSENPEDSSGYPKTQPSAEIDNRLFIRNDAEPADEVVPPSPSGSVRRSIAVDTEPSHYAVREMSSHAHLEYMQALILLKDGELAQLRREVEQLTQAKNTLLGELATASAKSEQLARLSGQSSQDMTSDSQLDEFQELQRRFNTLLVLYGQVTEENAELRMDLVDVKEMYKAQIDMLLRDQ